MLMNTEEPTLSWERFIHPETEALRRRDKFLRDLPPVVIDIKTGEITIEIPNLII